jgi:hypothetical protein
MMKPKHNNSSCENLFITTEQAVYLLFNPIFMKLILTFTAILMIQVCLAQSYHPFPTGNASWNNLTWAQWGPSPEQIHLINSQYIMEGDTLIEGKEYQKIFMASVDLGMFEPLYIGGLREDQDKNIYFFPYDIGLPTYSPSVFPTDTAETLLYTFNNLQVGMTLPINQGMTELTVLSIDSVLIGNSYRKRYEIVQNGTLFGPNYWIEGIGCIKDLFMPFTYEFEWALYTLCFTDTATYHLSYPWGAEDSCHYALPTGLIDPLDATVRLSPNPCYEFVNLEQSGLMLPARVQLINMQGQIRLEDDVNSLMHRLDVSHVPPGIYELLFYSEDRISRSKLLIQ